MLFSGELIIVRNFPFQNCLGLYFSAAVFQFLANEGCSLFNRTCLEPPSVEPYEWDPTDITKWPVSIAPLKFLCKVKGKSALKPVKRV